MVVEASSDAGGVITMSSEERLFALLVDETATAMSNLGRCPERDELGVAIVGLKRRLAIIRGAAV